MGKKEEIVIETIGFIAMFAFGLVLNYATIIQWFIPGHGITLIWNYYGEAYIEYIAAIIVLPCVLYVFTKNVKRLAEAWRNLSDG